MSLATTTDPVETIRLILDDQTTDADWSATSDWTGLGAKPADIERVEASDRNAKENRLQSDALYLWSPAEADLQKFSAAGDNSDDTEIVQVECWSPNSATTANNLAGDVADLVQDYTNDTETSTQWVDLWPERIADATGQTWARGRDHYIISVFVRLRGLRAR